MFPADYVSYLTLFGFLVSSSVLTLYFLNLWKTEKQSVEQFPVLPGSRMRYLFLKVLLFANFLRPISIVLELFVVESAVKSFRTWFRDVAMTFPSLIFLSAYSVVILFWAQIYKAATLQSSQYLKYVCIFANCLVYIIFTVIVILTLHMNAWKEVREYLLITQSVLYILTSCFLFNYGIKIAGHLSERRSAQRKHVIRRILVITCTVPLLLFVRGLYCGLVSLNFLHHSPEKLLTKRRFDDFVYFSTELVPSILFIFTFWPNQPSTNLLQEEQYSSVLSSESILSSHLIEYKDEDLPIEISIEQQL
jgi:Protein of unknown function (DUF1084)